MMDLQHLNVKIMADLNGVDPETLIPIFHKWIQTKATKEMLIDVADYLHVPEGPGVLLVGHEAFMSLDHGENRWGFLYNRRAPMNGGSQDRLQGVTRAALEHCKRLEEEEALRGKLKFRGEEIQLAVNDRLLAPNTEETFKSLEPEIKTFLGKLYGGAAYTYKRHNDPRERFTLDIKAQGTFTVTELLQKMP
jgi:hypothetical protein